jgi:hypothetical protein
VTADEENQLRQELLKMDIELRRKQAFWETPRNIAILLGVAVALAGAVGFKIGQTSPPNPIVIQLPQPAK